jgi:PAS domain S-box-containing protein
MKINGTIRVLFVEDIETDRMLAEKEMRKRGIQFESTRVDGDKEMRNVLLEVLPDIIISDYSMPSFDGMAALKIAHEMAPKTPFIILTGSINEEVAVECIKAGADDYILKENMSRLVPAVVGAIEKRKNIIAKEKAEASLLESEERYKTFFNNDITGDNMVDVNGTIIDCNPAFARMLGYNNPDELKGKNIELFYANPDERQVFINEIKESKKLSNATIDLKRKDSNIVHCELNSVGIFNTNNELIQTISYFIDVTKRKEAELQLRLLSRSVEQNPTSVEITNPKGEIVYVNPRFTQVSGYTFDEVVGKNPRILKSGMHPPAFYDEMWKTLKAGKVWNDTICNKRKDGSLLWENVYISPVEDESGEVTHYVSVKEDVTAQRRLDEIEHLILEIAQISVLNIDLHSFIAQVHQKMKKAFNAKNFYVALYNSSTNTYTFPYFIDEIDDFSGNKSFILTDSLTDHVRKNAKGKLVTSEIEDRIRNHENIELYGTDSAVWLGAPLINNQTGEAFGVIAVQDYHNANAYNEKDLQLIEIIAYNVGIFIERVQTVEELKLAKERAEESDRLKSAFLANMSHEIRTPMNGILGFVSLLKEGWIEPDVQNKYLTIVEQNGERLLGLINDLIDISRIESGQVQISNSELNINDEIQSICEFFMNEAGKKGLALETVIPAESNAILFADRVKFHSILSNLIKNALKFTSVGFVKVGYDFDGNFIRFFVKDSGIGIAAEKIDMVFRRFEQADQSLTKSYEGSGLGLAIARALTEKMGGKMWVESEPGKGSEFYFTLPLGSKN